MSKLKDSPRLLLIGAAGTGMQGLAQLLAARGHTVTRTDVNFSELQRIVTMGAEVVREEEAVKLLARTDLVVYSDAVAAEHPLRIAAGEAQIPALAYQDVLGELSREYTTVAVTGTHGKSSTTALLAFIATEAGLDPTVVLGAPMPAWDNQHGRVGHSSLFIIEADEYRDHFLTLSPTYAIITTIDFDHSDYFRSLAAVHASYQRFINSVPGSGAIITSNATRTSAPTIAWPSHTLFISDITVPPIPSLPGVHMQSNAQLAFVAAHQLGVPVGVAEQSLERFPGLGRRFETVGQIRRLTVISDYGHHPAEIAATLKAARERYPQKKIAVMLEAHTDVRLQTFFEDFVQALVIAPVDSIFICPTFYVQGREEKPIDSSKNLYDAIKSKSTVPVTYVPSHDAVAEVLSTSGQASDVLIAFTAGKLDSTLRAATQYRTRQ